MFQAIFDFVAIRCNLAWGQVVSCTLALVLMTLNINKPERQHVASVLNHVVVGFVLVAMVADVIKMSFGLDPGPVQKRSADENQ